VTSDQLRAKAGKVRCGYCQAVFNAFDELIDETQAVATQPLVEPPVSLGAAPHEYLQDEQTEAVGTVAADDEILNTEPEPVTDESEAAVTPEVEPEIESDDADEPDQGRSPEEVPEPLDSEAGEQGEIAPFEVLTATETEPAVPVPDETPEEATQAAREAGLVAARELSETPAFDRWATGTLSGRGPGGFDAEDGRRANWLFLVVALLLIAVLIAQIAYHFRTELVRSVPAAADVFAALDIPVPLPAHSDLVSIEASDLRSDNPRGLFVLNASLRNRAAYAQAWPALELTLIDASDAPVARRVMRAANYLPPGSDLTSFPANAEVPVRLWIDAKGLGASGYRLYIFYP
jgi:hypothetical protein